MARFRKKPVEVDAHPFDGSREAAEAIARALFSLEREVGDG